MGYRQARDLRNATATEALALLAIEPSDQSERLRRASAVAQLA